MDEWLGALTADESSAPALDRIARARPGDLVDACWSRDDDPVKIAEPSARGRGGCDELYPSAPGPREVAGAPIGSDVLKCQLRPVDLGNYDVTLTTEQRPSSRSSRPASATGRSPASAKPPRRTPSSALAARAPGSDGCLPSSGVGSKSACYRAQVLRVCIGQPPPRQRDQGMTAESWTVVAGGIGLAGRPGADGHRPHPRAGGGSGGVAPVPVYVRQLHRLRHRRRGRRADSCGGVSRHGFPRGIAAAGPLVFVAHRPAGLMVVGVSDPASPQVEGGLPLGRDPVLQVFAPDVRSLGGKPPAVVCIVRGRGGLQAVDISDPSAPRVASVVPVDGPPTGAALWGRRLYVASGGALQAFDLTDHARPALAASSDAGVATGPLAVDATHFFMATQEAVAITAGSKSPCRR